MRSTLLSSLAVCAALSPLAALADDLSYSYLDPAYISTDIDDFDEDVDGFALRGSLEIAEQAFLFAGYTSQSASVPGNDIDFTSMSIGGGYSWPLSNSTDIYGRVGYIEQEVEVGPFDFDDDGFLLGAGLRGRVGGEFELDGGINYVDLSDSGDDTSLYGAGRWYLNESLALGIEADIGDDVTTYGVGIRWNWGQ